MFYREQLDKKSTAYLPVFISFPTLIAGRNWNLLPLPWKFVCCRKCKSCFVDVNKVFSLAKVPFIIAGKDPQRNRKEN